LSGTRLSYVDDSWAVVPIPEAAYVKREVALQVLSARLAEFARDTDATAEQEREQKQIIRLLNLLVTDDSSAASARIITQLLAR